MFYSSGHPKKNQKTKTKNKLSTPADIGKNRLIKIKNKLKIKKRHICLGYLLYKIQFKENTAATMHH